MEHRDQIRQFLQKNFYVADPAAFTDSTSLLEAGILDSTGVLEVIAYLENEFQITVEDNEMLPENLDTVAQIVQFVRRKTGK